MILLSDKYVNTNAPEKMRVKENFVMNYVINICNLNCTALK